MPIVVLGISHKTAPPEVRDRHAFPAHRVAEALGALRDYGAIREAAILATCNRLEIYADVVDFEVGVGEIKDFLTTYRDMGVEDFDKYLYTLLGAEAIAQCLSVASGLDSMLIGEDEIVAQVKDALAAAEAAGSAGPHLSRLFRAALRTGKRVRTETAIGREAVSLGAAAIELAARRCRLEDAHAVVVGAGKMGAMAARHLRARGARAIAIVNRTESRARAVADGIDAQTKRFADLPALLDRADLLICAVGSGCHVVSADDLRAAMVRRAGRPLHIIDIAAPRDVDPAAKGVAGITLDELADLREVVDATIEARRSAVPAAEAIVDEHVRDYLRWYQSRAAVPLIAGLRRRAEAIRLAEIEKLFAKHPELDARQRDAVVAASVSIINKLLHVPLTKLRETIAESAESHAVVGRLFDLATIEEQIERQFAEALTPPRA